MLRKCLIIISLLCCICLSGCGGVNPQYKQASEIIRCLDENDAEALKGMFCERVVKAYDIDSQISEAMEFYSGTAVSCNKALIGGGSAYDDGVLTDKHIEYSVNNIKTNTENSYEIVTHSFLVYARDPRCVGITYLKVFDENTGEMIQIGEYVY